MQCPSSLLRLSWAACQSCKALWGTLQSTASPSGHSQSTTPDACRDSWRIPRWSCLKLNGKLVECGWATQNAPVESKTNLSFEMFEAIRTSSHPHRETYWETIVHAFQQNKHLSHCKRKQNNVKLTEAMPRKRQNILLLWLSQLLCFPCGVSIMFCRSKNSPARWVLDVQKGWVSDEEPDPAKHGPLPQNVQQYAEQMLPHPGAARSPEQRLATEVPSAECQSRHQVGLRLAHLQNRRECCFQCKQT